MKAKKLPSGAWRCQAYAGREPSGKKIIKSFTAKTRKEAELLANEFINGITEKREARAFSDVVASYIEGRSSVLSPATIRSYWGIYKNHLAGIGDKPAGLITSEDLQKQINEIYLTHSAKTTKNIASLFLAALEMAEPDKRYHVTLPKRPPLEYNVPTEAQVEKLIQEADKELKIVIVLSAFGTLRRGEICALSFSDILRDFSAVYVHADRVKGPDNLWYYKNMPKTSKSTRRVFLPPEVLDLIGTGDGYIIQSTPDAITKRFITLRNRLGLSCRLHDCRHFAASICHAIGIPDSYIQKRGGWSSDGTLKAVYRNTLEDQEARFTKKINNYLTDKIKITL